MGERTALVNAVHGLRNESGLVMPTGVAQFRQAVVKKLESEQDTLTPLSQAMLWKWVAECGALEKPLASDQEQREALATTHPACQRLRTIPGLGPCNAMALVAAVSDASACKHGRQCAAGLGRVPRPYATGGKAHLVGISTRGDSYVRQLLIQGARVTLR
jgi:transposase